MTAEAERVEGSHRTAGTLAALALLAAALPLTLSLTALAWLRGRLERPRERTSADEPLTVMLSGGKMTKSLALARAFNRAGHRVVLVEASKYRFTGHRLSNAVDAFHTVPPPSSPDYAAGLAEVARLERVDVYVPVCSPASSQPDAEAKAALEPKVQVVHPDAEVVRMLDDKHAFCRHAASLGLGVPDVHRITDPDEVAEFDFPEGRTYVLKSIAYDPVRRLDLTQLPLEDPERTREFVASLPISEANPWVLQEFLVGEELCSHSTVRNGKVQLHCCCRSSAFQLNYEMVDDPEIEEWVTRFAADLGVSGQLSFDFIRTADGRLGAIECNPRTHSAITMFYDHPGVAAAYLEDGPERIVPTASSKPTYWLFNELWRAASGRSSVGSVARTILGGKDAILDTRDPLPFLGVHALQIPSLLLSNLVRGKEWLKIDFNIGKLVEPAGD